MLFLNEGDFVEIVSESGYPGVFSVCCQTMLKAKIFAREAACLAEPIMVMNSNLPWVIHIEEDVLFSLTRNIDHKKIETVETFTPAPKAFAYSYLLPDSAKADGVGIGQYGFCWPEERQRVLERLTQSEEPVEHEIIFVPIWFTPSELIGAGYLSDSELD